MELNLNNITFIIVSFKSEKIIDDCLKSLPKNSKIIVIENSNNYNLKKSLELKYKSISLITDSMKYGIVSFLFTIE